MSRNITQQKRIKVSLVNSAQLVAAQGQSIAGIDKMNNTYHMQETFASRPKLSRGFSRNKAKSMFITTDTRRKGRC